MQSRNGCFPLATDQSHRTVDISKPRLVRSLGLRRGRMRHPLVVENALMSACRGLDCSTPPAAFATALPTVSAPVRAGAEQDAGLALSCQPSWGGQTESLLLAPAAMECAALMPYSLSGIVLVGSPHHAHNM